MQPVTCFSLLVSKAVNGDAGVEDAFRFLDECPFHVVIAICPPNTDGQIVRTRRELWWKNNRTQHVDWPNLQFHRVTSVPDRDVTCSMRCW
jgi:hypothetical protein